MHPTEGTFASSVDGIPLATYSWGDDISRPRGVVQITHGIAEHSLRYGRLATALTAAGYRVRAHDHRGHGKSAASAADLGHFGPAGFPGLVDDVAAFGAAIVAENPGTPVFLLGHSMGSFAAQWVILDHSDQYAGVVLSGSSAVDVLAANLAASAEPAGLAAFNTGFEYRTGFEWLSRDEAEVDKYVADPLSGFELPGDAVPQLFSGVGRLADPDALRGVRSGLPLLLASGQADPLSGDGQLVQLLGQRYRDAGISDVTVRVYPGARHEIFNEINRDEITADVIGWLNAHG